ncbi:Pantothenate transporter liz1 [Grifola frondosa]|uniref:Pantothenate transporter liz1 n=1 Tax=Grifola frondosa TaxID=5627 RepID=A0A1C7MJR8_GRIFR|nr:Pantothenate transporter liz1 [Grifola frondosa]
MLYDCVGMISVLTGITKGLISNAFGSLMASGILDSMEGKMGHAAWRWLFYIEGALTMFFAVAALFILPDFPATSQHVAEPARGDEAGGPRAGCLVVSLSFNAFFPTLSATMGYNPTVTLLLCAPPWAFATLVAFTASRHSDRYAARYVSLFLMAQSYAGFIIFLAWVSNSIPRPPSKRAVALALINAFSQLGNIAGSYVWPKGWGPTYRHSYAICIATNGLCIVMLYIFKRHLEGLNREIARKEAEEGTPKGFRYLT